MALSAVQKAIPAGRIAPTADGRIDPAQADADWQRNTAPRPERGIGIIRNRTSGSTRLPVSPPALDSTNLGGGYATARAVREQYLAQITKFSMTSWPENSSAGTKLRWKHEYILAVVFQ